MTTERELPDDDPENPKTYLDKFKRATPGETILAMLAEPTMTLHVTQSRICGSKVQLEISGRDWHTYQFQDALRRYQTELREIEARLPRHLAGELREAQRKLSAGEP